MIYLVETNRLLSLFNIDRFCDLESAIFSMAPSLCEYYLNDITADAQEDIYLNRSNIQNTIYTDLYNIYLDYDNNIYLEALANTDQFETESLW